MTGMKEGAGGDPFTDDTESDDNDTESDTTDMNETTTQPTRTEIPMILRRDSVQDNRDRYPLFLQQDTKRDERDALRELEDRFEDDISVTDLREALILVGLSNLDDVEGQLEDWGYGLTFE